MVKDVLDAYITRNVVQAEFECSCDSEVDTLHTSLFREFLTYMMEDPSQITACTHLLFIAKNIERTGYHATNIAENVYFLVHGKAPADSRLKEDKASFVVVKKKAKVELIKSNSDV